MQTGMQEFHRYSRVFNASKYLLITHSFPHSPQVFPQELSTGKVCCGYSFLVHIKCGGTDPELHTFLQVVDFAIGEFLWKNLDLTTWVVPVKKQKKFLKLGVDFVGQTRYNVCLYGKLEEGGAIHAQH